MHLCANASLAYFHHTFTNSCSLVNLFSVSDTLQFTMKSQALSVYLPPVDSLNPRPKQLPMAIPKDLASR